MQTSVVFLSLRLDVLNAPKCKIYIIQCNMLIL